MWIEKSSPLLLDLVQDPLPDCLKRVQGRLADVDARKTVHSFEVLDHVMMFGYPGNLGDAE
jgi:hypothetical protein